MGGLETVAAGGMHTLTVDENGRVRRDRAIKWERKVD